MRRDVLEAYPQVDPERVHVVHNGIDTDVYRPDPDVDALERLGVPLDRPYVLFVGRITRQKGLVHLLAAARDFDPDTVLVLAASSPDTPEIGAETARLVETVRAERGESSVVWIQEQATLPDVRQLLTHARVFACPSVYEPLGIVNLEAMACETPSSRVPSAASPRSCGRCDRPARPYDGDDPGGFEMGLAAAINAVVADPERATEMGRAGRARAIADFGWGAIAERTVEVYAEALRA